MSKLGVSTVTTLQAVPVQAWNRLAHGSMFASHGWLAAQEGWSPVRHRYLLAHSDGDLLGAMPVYDDEQGFWSQYRLSNVFDTLNFDGHYLIAGGVAGYHHDLLIAGDLDDGERRQVLSALLEAARDAAAATAAQGVVFFYTPHEAARELAASEGALPPLLMPPEAVVPLPGNRFADYLHSLKSHKRREIGREERVFNAAGFRLETGPLSRYLSEAAPLLAQVEGKYGNNVDIDIFEDSLRRQAEALDERSVVFACREGTDLVGFVLAFEWGSTLYARTIGFDYERLRGAYEYFNLTYYQPIHHAYRRGLNALHLGLDSYDGKLSRGARLEPLWTIVIPGDGLERVPWIM